MEIRPIKSDTDYSETLKEIESLMMAEANSPEGDRLDVLVTLVEAYERKHYPRKPDKTLDSSQRPNSVEAGLEYWCLIG